jgi:hypothetical protein
MTPRELANEHSKKHNERTAGGDSDAPKKIRKLQDRIKLLEEAGDRILNANNDDEEYEAIKHWTKAKEAKP